MARDLDRIMEFVDYDTTGFFSPKQVGQCLHLLKVFKQMFNENVNKVNEIRKEREELFLMHLWYLLNPIDSA